MAATYGKKYAVACTSGTAALHIALGAIGVAPGDEVITSTLTDAGCFIGVLYQDAVPIFVDVDPRTYNMTAETIRRGMTSISRTESWSLASTSIESRQVRRR